MADHQDSITIALAQLNLLTGDIRQNTKQIIDALHTARDRQHADIIIFPELAITGYPPEDLLLRSGFYTHIQRAMATITHHVQGISVILGYPERESSRCFNSCAVLQDQAIRYNYRKQLLPNYAVFDEKRYFTAGDRPCVFTLHGINMAISICEDLWEDGPVRQAAQQGAKLLFNINASPFHRGKVEERQALLRRRARENGINIVYANLIGGQDELVFDGSSMTITRDGELMPCAPQFESGLYPVHFDKQTHTFYREEPPLEPLSTEEQVYRALVLGVRDYVCKNAFTGAVIGLSGGIDSALSLCIAVDALGPDRVEVLLMPSRYTATISIEDAQKQAKALGVKSHIISIEQPFSAFQAVLQPLADSQGDGTIEENIQARTRGVLLMAWSNRTGKIVLTTGNKSEMAVGYATLYGDMAGGFAPLKDVPKGLVYQLANWRNKTHQVIPRRVLTRAPSAELRPNQRDEDSLPPYEILDPILEYYIEQDSCPADIVAAGYAPEIVAKVIRLIDYNEYKRRQAAPGIKITKRAFGRDRRYPITNGYRE